MQYKCTNIDSPISISAELDKKICAFSNLQLFLDSCRINETSNCMEYLIDPVNNNIDKPRLNHVRIALIIFILFLVSCRNNTFQADISGIELNLKIKRFETELFTVDPSGIENHIPKWEDEYGIFFQHYNYILGLGTSKRAGYADDLRMFVTDPFNYRIYRRTMEIFPDLDQITADLGAAFSRYLYYFPERTVPEIFTYVSGFTQTAISDDSLLAIGLDKYLGTTEDFYNEIGVYQYLKKNMHPQKVLSDCMLFWAETEFAYNDSVNNLLSNMIYKGKLMYLVDALLPEHPDTLKWGFSSDEFIFCLNNEKQMWTYLVGNKLLFNTDRFTIDKFIAEGPFTSDFSDKSPGRAAIWTGYRIVDSYMRKNPDTSVKELMAEEDYMSILNLSAYNP